MTTSQNLKIHFSAHFYKSRRVHRTCSLALTWKQHVLLIAGLCESLQMLIRSICLSHSQSGGQWLRQHSLFDLHIKHAHRLRTEYTPPPPIWTHFTSEFLSYSQSPNKKECAPGVCLLQQLLGGQQIMVITPSSLQLNCQD